MAKKLTTVRAKTTKAPTKIRRVAPAKPAPAKQPEKRPEKPKGADTGSAEVQVNFMTGRIKELIAHLRRHPKDFDSKRGLLMIVGKRRRLLNYLARTQPKKYDKLVTSLKLKKS